MSLLLLLSSQPAVSSNPGAVVSGAGTSAANGLYTYRGQYDGGAGPFPYYNLEGHPDNPLSFSIVNQFATWVISPVNQDDGNYYGGNTPGLAFPWLDTYSESDLGASPPPSVTQG